MPGPAYQRIKAWLLSRIEAVKYTSAALFWALYAYGVWDAHRNFVPIVETEMGTAGQLDGSAHGAGQFYSRAVTEARDATAKAANDARETEWSRVRCTG